MFDDVSRELRRLEKGVRIPVEMRLDDDGYVDRRCPCEACSHQFKVLFEDWREKVPNERVFCPFCGHEGGSGEWDTDEQEEYIASKSKQYVSDALDRAFTKSARRFNQKQRSRNQLIDISMSMEYKPGSRIIAVPPAAAEALRQQFVCETCGCHWTSLGVSYFCPACGNNSVASAFNTTLTTVREFIQSVKPLRATLQGILGEGSAETMIRQLVEDQFARLTGAFEQLSESLFDSLPNANAYAKKGNVFQRVHDASDLWKQASGKGYDDFLPSDDLAELSRLVQQRHILSHKQGIVDQTYIVRSDDTRFRPGQRLVVRPEDVSRLTDLIETLGRKLMSHVESEGS